jgi:hypothetical protein
MIADNLGISKVMKLIHQAVVKRFMLCVPDHLHPYRTQLSQGAVDGGLVHMDYSSGPANVFGSDPGRRIINQAFSVKGQKKLPAGHIFKAAAGLNPVPVFAQFPGNMSPAPVPVFIDQFLDNGQIFGGNFAVSYE